MYRFSKIITEILFLGLIFALPIQAQQNLPNNEAKFLQTQWTTDNGLPQNSLTSIAQTRDGYLWVGTFGGLARFDGVRFKIYTTSNTPELKSNRITDLTTDKKGTLRIGTYRGCLNRYKDGKWTHITTDNGFFDDIVSRILVKDEDNFWMLGNRGIYSASRQMLNDFADGKIEQIYCSAYTTADGMITSEGNGGYQNAGIKARDGKLWFPMINGVVIIDPKQKKIAPAKSAYRGSFRR
jgi:ligand-binding sensor domain-containing protein